MWNSAWGSDRMRDLPMCEVWTSIILRAKLSVSLLVSISIYKDILSFIVYKSANQKDTLMVNLKYSNHTGIKLKSKFKTHSRGWSTLISVSMMIILSQQEFCSWWKASPISTSFPLAPTTFWSVVEPVLSLYTVISTVVHIVWDQSLSAWHTNVSGGSNIDLPEIVKLPSFKLETMQLA